MIGSPFNPSRRLLCPGGGGGGAPSQSQSSDTYDERIAVDGDNNVTVRDAQGNVVISNVPVDVAQEALRLAGQTAQSFLDSVDNNTALAAEAAQAFLSVAQATNDTALQTAGDLGANALATAQSLNADALQTAGDLGAGAQATSLSLFERGVEALREMLATSTAFAEKALKTQADTSAGALNAAGAVANSQSKFLATQTGQDGLVTVLKYGAISAVVIIIGAVLLPALFKGKASA